jgi:hypothetical protein
VESSTTVTLAVHDAVPPAGLAEAIQARVAGGRSPLTGFSAVWGPAGGPVDFPEWLLLAGDGVLAGWECLPAGAEPEAPHLRAAFDRARRLALPVSVVWHDAGAVLIGCTEPDGPRVAGRWERSEESPGHLVPAWRRLLDEVLAELETRLATGRLRATPASAWFERGILLESMLEDAPRVAEHAADSAEINLEFAAEVDRWWASAHAGHPDHTRPWQPLAHWVLFAWTARIVFAHAVTPDDPAVATVLGDAADASEGEARVERIAWRHGAFTLLGPAFAGRQLPRETWVRIRALDAVLAGLRLHARARGVVLRLLDALVESARQRLAPAFATPAPLAALMARLALQNGARPALDPFCGTGTIVRAIVDDKLQRGVRRALALGGTWGTDRSDLFLRVAALSLASPEPQDEPARLFVADGFVLEPGLMATVDRPSGRDDPRATLPRFGAIVTEPPRVNAGELERSRAIGMSVFREAALPAHPPAYAYVPVVLWNLLEPGGRLVLALPDGWLHEPWARAFRRSTLLHYRCEAVVILRGREPFQSPNPASTLLVLERRRARCTPLPEERTRFVTLRGSFGRAGSIGEAREVADQLLRGEIASPAYAMEDLAAREIAVLEQSELPWTAFFADCAWIPQVRNLLVPATAFVEFARGAPGEGGWMLPCGEPDTSARANGRLLFSRPSAQHAGRGPLLQALLATSVTMFQLESLRALARVGAQIPLALLRHHVHVPDWRRLPLTIQERITHAYQPLARREPLPAAEEFRRADRHAFEAAVWNAFGVPDLAERVPAALIELVDRLHARGDAS